MQSFPRITRIYADADGIIRDDPRNPRESIRRIPASAKYQKLDLTE